MDNDRENEDQRNDDTEDRDDDGRKDEQRGSDQPKKFEWNADQQAEINRIAKNAENRGVTKGKDEAKREAQRKKDEEDGNYKSLLEQSNESNKTLRKKVRNQAAESSVARVANDLGAIDPDAIFAMVKDHIEFSDDDEPKNVADVVKSLKERKPKLFEGKERTRRKSIDSTERGGGKPSKSMNDLIRRAAGVNTE